MNYSVIVSLVTIIIVLFTNHVTCRRTSTNNNRRINENMNGNMFPTLVEAISPKGLRVSITDVPGIELFAFHGKVNSPIRHLEAGSMSQDILYPTNGRWVFQNNDIRLQIGDVINYWVFIQANGSGIRLDNLSSVIKEFVPETNINDDHSSSSSSSSSSLDSINCHRNTNCRQQQIEELSTISKTVHTNNCNSEQLNMISAQLNVTLMQLTSLHDKLAPLQSQVISQTELLQELIKDMNIGTKLLVTGYQPPGSNPVEQVRYLITEQLELYDLDRKILQAHHTTDGIVFEMSSPIDKKRILFRAQKNPINRYQFEDIRDNESVLPKIDVRSNI